MENLNLIFDTECFVSELDEYEIKNLIVGIKRELGLVTFDDFRTPFFYQIIIDGITMDDEQYRLSILIKDRTIYREVEISAGGSGVRDKLKAKLLNRKDILYSMDASQDARQILSYVLSKAERR